MKISNQNLIEDLIQRSKENLNKAQTFQELNAEELNWKKDQQNWSILECVEHLNRYGDFYLPEIKRRMINAEPVDSETVFKSGWLGNYFANSLLPREKLNKMKTFKEMNPSGSSLGKEVLDKFVNQQKKMLDLLDKARRVDMKKVKTAISISTFIKLRLGDTFRVVIYHNQRHMVQAERVRSEMEVWEE